MTNILKKSDARVAVPPKIISNVGELQYRIKQLNVDIARIEGLIAEHNKRMDAKFPIINETLEELTNQVLDTGNAIKRQGSQIRENNENIKALSHRTAINLNKIESHEHQDIDNDIQNLYLVIEGLCERIEYLEAPWWERLWDGISEKWLQITGSSNNNSRP